MTNFILGVLASIVATVLVKISICFVKWMRSGRIKKALGIQDGNIQVYFGGYSSQEAQSKDIFIHAEAIHTVQKLQPILDKYQINHSYHVDKEQNPIRASECVVCIGGEYVNIISEKYLNDFIGKSKYLEEPLAVDHSVIIKMTPSSSKNVNPKSVFLLIGATGRDTKSAVSYFAQNFPWLVKEKLSKPNMIIFLKTQDEENSTLEIPSVVSFEK